MPDPGGVKPGLTDDEMDLVYIQHRDSCPSASLFPAQCDCGHEELKAKVRGLLAPSGGGTLRVVNEATGTAVRGPLKAKESADDE